jgi:hypothetical protein
MSAALREALRMGPAGEIPAAVVCGVPSDAPFAGRCAFQGGSRGWDREQLRAVAAGRLDQQVIGEMAMLNATLAMFE